MAITTFLQQLESGLVDKPEALAVVARYRSDLETADAQSDKDKLIALQDQMHDELADALNAVVDPQNPAPTTAPTSPLLIGGTLKVMDQFQIWLDNGTLSSTEKTKLIDMAQGYDDAARMARSMDPNVAIKSLKDLLTVILQLDPMKLKEIANFQRPMLIVTPQNAFATKIDAMNTTKPYRTKGAKPQDQDDAFVWDDPKSPYTPIGAPSKVSISIVDGGTHMPHIADIASDLRFDQRKLKFKEHYEKKNMRMINAHEYAMLMQRSLNEYKKSGNDESKIVDFYKDGNDTITCLDDEYLNASPRVAYGYFNSGDRQVDFYANNADDTDADLRGRPSVQVMEY